jgi:colicin import membrane protein
MIEVSAGAHLSPAVIVHDEAVRAFVEINPSERHAAEVKKKKQAFLAAKQAKALKRKKALNAKKLYNLLKQQEAYSKRASLAATISHVRATETPKHELSAKEQAKLDAKQQRIKALAAKRAAAKKKSLLKKEALARKKAARKLAMQKKLDAIKFKKAERKKKILLKKAAAAKKKKLRLLAFKRKKAKKAALKKKIAKAKRAAKLAKKKAKAAAAKAKRAERKEQAHQRALQRKKKKAAMLAQKAKQDEINKKYQAAERKKRLAEERKKALKNSRSDADRRQLEKEQLASLKRTLKRVKNTLKAEKAKNSITAKMLAVKAAEQKQNEMKAGLMHQAAAAAHKREARRLKGLPDLPEPPQENDEIDDLALPNGPANKAPVGPADRTPFDFMEVKAQAAPATKPKVEIVDKIELAPQPPKGFKGVKPIILDETPVAPKKPAAADGKKDSSKGSKKKSLVESELIEPDYSMVELSSAAKPKVEVVDKIELAPQPPKGFKGVKPIILDETPVAPKKPAAADGKKGSSKGSKKKSLVESELIEPDYSMVELSSAAKPKVEVVDKIELAPQPPKGFKGVKPTIIIEAPKKPAAADGKTGGKKGRSSSH